MKLRDLGEFKLIDQIRRQTPGGCGVRRGIGDDAAVVEIPEGHHLLTSTDMLIEGVHFRRDWTSCEDLGHKAVAVNLSDIAAMGGSPRYLYLGLACPGDTELDDISAFARGALAEATENGVALVGGDTCHSPGPWIISVTIEGSAPVGQEVGRDGARPDDLVMASGTLGDSALALRLLNSGETVSPELLARHHRPTARIELGRRLADQGLASAMIDLSDGLAGDLEHILQASGVEGLVEVDRLPLSGAFRQHLATEPAIAELALFGGEDYELLFTTAPQNAAAVAELAAQVGVTVTTIGAIREGSGALFLRDHEGEVRPILVRSYDHFCRS